jgi:hypothetical protein
MVGILYREFVKSREPSDLTEKQGSYREFFQRFKLRRDRAIDSSQQGPLDLPEYFHFGVSWIDPQFDPSAQ